jgi:integrase
VYDVRWRERGRACSRTFATEDDARTFRARIEAGVTTPEARTPRRNAPTVATVHAEWLAARRVSRGRASSERSHGKHLLDALGSVLVAELTSVDVRAWIATQVDHPYSAESIAARLRMLRQVLDTAIEAGYVSVNAAARVKAPRIKRPPLDADDVLTPSEAAWLIEATPDRWRALIGLLAYVGPRWGEALAVGVEDVDLLRRRIHLGHRVVEEVDGQLALRDGGKTRGSDRVVPLPLPVAQLLEHHLSTYPPNRHGLIFVGAYGASPYRSPFRARVLRPALKAAGLEGRSLSMRKLRHSSASMMLPTMDPVDVARRLGHSRPSTTLDIYARFLPDREDAATEAYEATLRSWAGPKPSHTHRTSGVVECDPVRASEG